MADIRASCPECGDIELTGHDITAVIYSDMREGFYRFICPKQEHQRLVIKSAEPRIIDLLVQGGGAELVLIDLTSMKSPSVVAQEQAIATQYGPINDNESIDLGMLTSEEFTAQVYEQLGL